MASVEEFEAEVYDRISTILITLSDLTSGEYSVRVPDPGLPDDHPISALTRGINEMVESLAQAQRRTLAYQTELEEKIATIDQQREAIRELSTPVIEVWDGVLCLPIVGVMDTLRSTEMTEALLKAVVDKKARYTIIDITGIEAMDTRTADHFIRMAQAVRLLGADCVLTGISPAIAQTIVHMGVDLSGLITHRSLRNALQQHVSARATGAPRHVPGSAAKKPPHLNGAGAQNRPR
jgi:rsbT co-antagonist protein RsbR